MRYPQFTIPIILMCIFSIANAQPLLIEIAKPIRIETKAKAAPRQEHISTANNWALFCSAQNAQTAPKCKMEYLPAANSALPFQISIEFLKISKQKPATAIAIITTPLNILLSTGLILTPDRMKKFNLAVRSCHVDLATSNTVVKTSCLAPFKLNKNIINAFKNGNQFTLQAKSLNGKIISQTISLIGFTKIFNQFKKQP
ncbi:MAG: invasion associated locus B family protein [Hyphomicrobiales bacterium]